MLKKKGSSDTILREQRSRSSNVRPPHGQNLVLPDLTASHDHERAPATAVSDAARVFFREGQAVDSRRSVRPSVPIIPPRQPRGRRRAADSGTRMFNISMFTPKPTEGRGAEKKSIMVHFATKPK